MSDLSNTIAAGQAYAPGSVQRLASMSYGLTSLDGTTSATLGADGSINFHGAVSTGLSIGTVKARGNHTGQTAAQVSTDGNNSTPSTTETYISEINIPGSMTITGIALFNGTDVTGNVTVGLADSTGAPIAAAKSASTAGSGTDAYQLVPFAAPYVASGPGTFYIQVQYSSATARYNTHHIGTHATSKQTTQTYGSFTSFTPPTAFVADIGNIASLY